MSIYYQDEWAILHHGDSIDILPTIEPADLIVTDPPYGIQFRSNRREESFSRIRGDDSTLRMTYLVADAIRDNLRRYRHAYVFGPFDFTPLVEAGTIQEPATLIWDKHVLGMGNLKIPWASQHEEISFMVAVKSNANVKKGEGRLASRLRRGSILTHQRPHAAGVKKHPTEKPVPLLRELIESSSCVGEVVLDPFAGSGSTLVAATIEGRKSVGVELDEGYCETAARRLQAAAEVMKSVTRL